MHNVLMNVLIPPEMLAKQEGGERERRTYGEYRADWIYLNCLLGRQRRIGYNHCLTWIAATDTPV